MSAMEKQKQSETQAEVSLRQSGLRATHARVAVLEELSCCDGPVMAEALHERCNLPLSTVYRVLSDLEEHGLAEKTYDEAHSCARYTAKGRAPCCVFHCLGCETDVTIHIEAAEQAAEEKGRALGFETLSHRIELTGYCARCREAQRQNEQKSEPGIAGGAGRDGAPDA